MFKKIKNEFRETKQTNEDFLQWLLIRKLSTKEKWLLALFLWILWIKYAFNIAFMFNFFKVILLISLIYGLLSMISRLLEIIHKK